MNGKPVLVDTDTAVALLVKETASGLSADFWQRWIYNSARTGALTRYGNSGRGQARWDWREIERLVY